jgi:hypothetical protein
MFDKNAPKNKKKPQQKNNNNNIMPYLIFLKRTTQGVKITKYYLNNTMLLFLAREINIVKLGKYIYPLAIT